MDFSNYKYKMVVVVSLLNSEKERIKQILDAYNIRLIYIYILVLNQYLMI